MVSIEKRVGSWIGSSGASSQGAYKCYIPKLFPLNPPLDMERLAPSLERASSALGALKGILDFLPEQELFLFCYLKKEAVLSSQIEGTQSSFSIFFFSKPLKNFIRIETQ